MRATSLHALGRRQFRPPAPKKDAGKGVGKEKKCRQSSFLRLEMPPNLHSFPALWYPSTCAVAGGEMISNMWRGYMQRRLKRRGVGRQVYARRSGPPPLAKHSCARALSPPFFLTTQLHTR